MRLLKVPICQYREINISDLKVFAVIIVYKPKEILFTLLISLPILECKIARFDPEISTYTAQCNGEKLLP